MLKGWIWFQFSEEKKQKHLDFNTVDPTQVATILPSAHRILRSVSRKSKIQRLFCKWATASTTNVALNSWILYHVDFQEETKTGIVLQVKWGRGHSTHCILHCVYFQEGTDKEIVLQVEYFGERGKKEIKVACGKISGKRFTDTHRRRPLHSFWTMILVFFSSRNLCLEW